MNKPKCDDMVYIHFLIATRKVFKNMEAASSHLQVEEDYPADIAFNPEKSSNCRARSTALFATLSQVGEIEKNMILT